MYSTAKQIPQTDIVIDTSELQLHTEQLFHRIKQQNKLPLLICEICFSDDVWDFSATKKVNIPDTKFRISFRNVPDCYADPVRFYAFIELSRGNVKVQTITEQIRSIARFLNRQFVLGYTLVEDIALREVEVYFHRFNSNHAFANNADAIRKFLIDYKMLIHPCYIDQDILDYLQQKNFDAMRAEREASKLPDIPADYFNKLLDVTLQVIKSSDPEDQRFHHIANMLLLLMQTGLRIGELCALTTDCLRIIAFNGKRLVQLEYTTWKRERGTNVSSKVITAANELAEFAVTNLINELHEARIKSGTNYLLVDPVKDRSYPIPGEIFAGKELKMYYLYIDKYMETVNIDEGIYSGLRRTKATSFMGETKKYRNLNITHPVTEQYRVHVCTELYASGVSLEYITKYMGHLSSHMKGYYVRPKAHEQEDAAFSRSVLSKIVSGDIEPLGGKESLMQKINEFIDANNFNASADLDVIVEELMKKVPIRQKAGGVCIKSSMLRDCSVDAETNEFYCAYNVCPNIYHFFYMADYTYQQATDLNQSIGVNTKHGFLRQAEKDRNMLRTLSKQKLIPELDSLKKYIDRDGAEDVLSQYPNLSYVIENLDTIYQEAVTWTTSN